jgi:ribosomal protein S1
MNEDNQWEIAKKNFPIGRKFYGTVIRIEPFGVFVNIGYKVIDGYKLSGIIDIITKSDNDSEGLPLDYSFWPILGQKVYCKVLAYREAPKEVSLSLVKNQNFPDGQQ